MRKKLRRFIGYPLFFGFCFTVFAYLTFPYDRVKERIIQEVESPLGPGGVRSPSGFGLEIVDLSPSFVTGVTLTGVTLTKAPETPGTPPLAMTLPRVHARVGLLALLTGSVAVTFEGELAGGSFEGEVQRGEESERLVLDADGLNLRRMGLLRAYFGLPLRGRLTADVDLTLAAEAANTAGHVNLDVDGLQVGDGNAKLKVDALPGDGFTLEQIDAGVLAIRANVEAGVMDFERLQSRGPDLNLDGEGSITLLRPLRASRIDLLMRADVKESYREKSTKTRALFSLMEVTPRLRAATTPDGAVQYRVSGTFGGRIRAQGAGRAPAPAGASLRAAGEGAPMGGAGEDDAEKSDDDGADTDNDAERDDG
ncbi:MAG: type II secretion system protein GspN [Myxococcota bacterium]